MRRWRLISFGRLSGVQVLGCSGALLLVAAVAAQNRGPAELALAPVAPGAIRIAYGSDPLQFGELRVPAAKGPHPVAIVGACVSPPSKRLTVAARHPVNG